MITLRLYALTDEAEVINLWRVCNLLRPWNNPWQDIARKLAEDPSLFFVAEQNGRVIGSCLAGYDGHRGWIYYLAVHPDCRGNGLATKLMQHAEIALQDQGCPKVELMVRSTNVAVLDFYSRIGYEQEPVVVLSKRLLDDEAYQLDER